MKNGTCIIESEAIAGALGRANHRPCVEDVQATAEAWNNGGVWFGDWGKWGNYDFYEGLEQQACG